MAYHVPNSPFHQPRRGTWPLQGHAFTDLRTLEEAFDLYEDIRDPFGTVRDSYPEAREFSLDRGVA